MKKPLNYFGYAFDKPEKGYNKAYLKTKKSKKDIIEDKKYNNKLKKQLKEKGFDKSELWNLDNTIISFTLPRLKEFNKNTVGYPNNLTPKKWGKIINKIIIGFELYLEDDFDIDEINSSKIDRSFKLFGKYLRHLWI